MVSWHTIQSCVRVCFCIKKLDHSQCVVFFCWKSHSGTKTLVAIFFFGTFPLILTKGEVFDYTRGSINNTKYSLRVFFSCALIRLASNFFPISIKHYFNVFSHISMLVIFSSSLVLMKFYSLANLILKSIDENILLEKQTMCENWTMFRCELFEFVCIETTLLHSFALSTRITFVLSSKAPIIWIMKLKLSIFWLPPSLWFKDTHLHIRV